MSVKSKYFLQDITRYNTKKKNIKKIDAAHFLDARGNEKQVSNLEWRKSESLSVLTKT